MLTERRKKSYLHKQSKVNQEVKKQQTTSGDSKTLPLVIQ